MLSYFDSHAHLTSNALYPDIDKILGRAKSCGIDTIVNICTDIDTLNRGIDLKKIYPWIFNAAATTPHDVAKEGESVFPFIEKHAKEGSLIAVGETGLDYFYNHSPKDVQQHFFRRYLHLALECNLPVIIHCRDAFADFFTILDEEYTVNGKHAPGVLHCFTGTLHEAEEVIKRGWMLSLSGIVTFKKSQELKEVAKMVPLDQLLIETDAPYLAPQSKRGTQNEPSFITETASIIASLKGLDEETVAKASYSNAVKLFKCSKTTL